MTDTGERRRSSDVLLGEAVGELRGLTRVVTAMDEKLDKIHPSVLSNSSRIGTLETWRNTIAEPHIKKVDRLLTEATGGAKVIRALKNLALVGSGAVGATFGTKLLAAILAAFPR